MTPTEFFTMLNGTTAASGGTPHGVSAATKAAACGMKAVFSEAAGAFQPAAFPQQFLDARGKARVVGQRAGSAFHALQELWRKGTLPTGLPLPASVRELDASAAEGLFAFNRRCEENGADGFNFLGVLQDAEYPVAGTIAGLQKTGRLDAVYRAEAEHVDRWAEFGLFSAAPGLYLWDDKLLAAVSHDKAAKYQREMQSQTYMALYEQQTGVRPAGFIHELYSRAMKPTLKRLLVLTPNNSAGRRVVDHAMALAERNRNSGEANPFACDAGYNPCPFVGICPRRGIAADYPDVITIIKQRAVTLDEADDE